jgi:hypothetical protein
MLVTLLIVLIVLALIGGVGWPSYRGPGLGLGGILLIVLLVILLTRA